MTNLQRLVVGIIAVGAILGTVAFAGLSPYIKVVEQNFGSPAGSTFGTAKVAAVNYTPSVAAASSTSMLNTDASNRVITGGFVYCTGVTGQGGIFKFATTSVANEGLQGNTNLPETIFATTSAVGIIDMYSASTTGTTLATGVNFVWPSNTYLTILDSATNAGVCTVGVNYLGS